MIRVPIRELQEGLQSLPEDTTRYVRRVLRLGPGDRFLAFDPEARTEADVELGEETIRVTNLRPGAVVATTPITLIQSLAKGDKIDAIARDATELGVTRIVLARAERSIVRADAKKVERLKRIVEQAARQCGRSDPPTIDVQNFINTLDIEAKARFILDPRAQKPLGPALALAVAKPMAFAVGPEGGFSSSEIEQAIAKDWQPVTLGPFILRTETVATAVLGAARILA